MRYPLLSDYFKNNSLHYGVLDEAEGYALRALFLIDPEGIIRQITVNDLPITRTVDETLRLIKAYKDPQHHGEGKRHFKVSNGIGNP